MSALTLLLLGCLQGCAGQGALAVKDITTGYLAPPAKDVKTFDLAKLARPTESQVRLRPGDFLEITCSNLFTETSRGTKDTETFPVRVGDDGAVSLPLLSERLTVCNMSVGEAEQVMRNAYRSAKLLHQPQLTAKMLEAKKNKIYVIGAVKKPGIYELRPDHCDPLRAIAAAEGLSEEAGTVIEIRRACKVSLPADPVPAAEAADSQTSDASVPANAERTATDEQALQFDLSDNIRLRPDQLQLQNGDIVSVEQKKKRMVYVSGSVNKPGDFPMPLGRELRVLEAIGMAGGVLTSSEPNNALLTRRPDGKPPIVVHFVLDRTARNPQENICLMEGDVITVVEDWASQARRYLRQICRFGFVPILP